MLALAVIESFNKIKDGQAGFGLATLKIGPTLIHYPNPH